MKCHECQGRQAAVVFKRVAQGEGEALWLLLQHVAQQQRQPEDDAERHRPRRQFDEPGDKQQTSGHNGDAAGQ